MEEYIGSILWLDTAVWREIGVIRDLQQALQAGQLTEGLCPMALLEAIERLAQEHGLRALPKEWYYENVKVMPFMICEGLRTFGVTLPFTNERIYRRYTIQAFKVPVNDIGLRARVDIEPDIALDTQDGYWFVPTVCVGHRPQM